MFNNCSAFCLIKLTLRWTVAILCNIICLKLIVIEFDIMIEGIKRKFWGNICLARVNIFMAKSKN